MMKRILLTALVLAVCAFAAMADIPPAPGKSPNRVKKPASVNTDMDIRLDASAKEARLIIPASQLKQLRADLEALDDGATAAGISSDGGLRLQTIMTGTLLSIAFIFGGLWLWRSGGEGPRNNTVRAAIVLVGLTAGAGFILANAGPPSEARTITGKMFAPAVHIYGHGWGRVRLETGPGDRVELIVPNPKTPKAEE